MKNAINPLISGVNGSECNPISTKIHETKRICLTNDAEFVDPDPGHSFEAVQQQVVGSASASSYSLLPPPSMNGFVEQALSISEKLSETVMKGFKPGNLTVFAKLVAEFAIFDR